MTINQFIILTIPEQEKLVHKNGVFLTHYVQGDIICDVYQLSDFFVKFHYDLTHDEDRLITSCHDDFQLYIAEQPRLLNLNDSVKNENEKSRQTIQ